MRQQNLLNDDSSVLPTIKNPSTFSLQLRFPLITERVAVKIIDKGKLDSKTHRMVTREIQITDALSHPHLIRFVKSCTSIFRTTTRLYVKNKHITYTTETNLHPIYFQLIIINTKADGFTEKFTSLFGNTTRKMTKSYNPINITISFCFVQFLQLFMLLLFNDFLNAELKFMVLCIEHTECIHDTLKI